MLCQLCQNLQLVPAPERGNEIRAFRTAEAKNVLMTLSKVGDEDSKEFMTKFYEIWLTAPEGASPSDALNETRRYFIGHENPKYRDPAFWSPYVMVGA